MQSFADVFQFCVGFAIFGGIWHAFARIDPLISPTAKRQLANWLLHVDVHAGLNRWPGVFLAIFDRVFGSRHFTLKCFRRSAYFSVASVLILTVVWASIRPDEFQTFLHGDLAFDRFLFPILILLMNVIPDYVSLLQTRTLLGFLKPEYHWFTTIGVLVLDWTASTVIFFVIALPSLSAANWVNWYIGAASAGMDPIAALAEASPTGTAAGALVTAYESLLENLFKGGIYLRTFDRGASLGPFFYSTYITSTWVLLHALGCLAARHARHLSRIAGSLRWLFDVENSPVRVVGFFAGAVASLFYWFLASFVAVAS